jgi:hypothetical protein
MLRKENHLLRLAKDLDVNIAIPLMVAARGGVSAYGFGRYPVTLYMKQWIKVIYNMQRIAFIDENSSKLASD